MRNNRKRKCTYKGYHRKNYEGRRFGSKLQVTVDSIYEYQSDERPCDWEVEIHSAPLTQIVKHSPTGFEWGYGGSGPADLALSILVNYIGSEEEAEKYYQEFKRDFIANFDHGGWAICWADIGDWLETKQRS